MRKAYSRLEKRESAKEGINRRNNEINGLNNENDQQQFKHSTLLLLVLLCALIYAASGNADVQKIKTEAFTCWEQFKQSDCDIDNPIGFLCQ